jgi:hypothetical protein
VTCVLPPGEGQDVMVVLANARYPGLWTQVPYLSYQVGRSSGRGRLTSSLQTKEMSGPAWDLDR